MTLPGARRPRSVEGRGVAATVVVLRDGTEVARWVLDLSNGIDLAMVEEVARLQLAARRSDCSIQLRDPHPALVVLLALVGLVEVIGQAEGGEEVGVEEKVEPGDPIA